MPHIPALQTAYALSDGALGVVLLGMALGAIVALPLAGWLVAKTGSRRLTIIAAACFCLALPLPVLSPGIVLATISLALFGAFNATLDVAMNAQAVEFERRYRRAIMSSFHGLFSLGGLAGATTAGAAMASGLGNITHVVVVSVWLALTSPTPFRSCSVPPAGFRALSPVPHWPRLQPPVISGSWPAPL